MSDKCDTETKIVQVVASAIIRYSFDLECPTDWGEDELKQAIQKAGGEGAEYCLNEGTREATALQDFELEMVEDAEPGAEAAFTVKNGVIVDPHEWLRIEKIRRLC